MKLILLTSLISVLTVLTLIILVPSTTPFSVFSTHPLGLSIAEKDFVNSGNIVVIVQPRHSVDQLVNNVLKNNGTVVLIGDNSVINDTLKEFGAYIDKSVIVDPLFNAGDESEVEVFYKGKPAVFLNPHPIYNVTPLVETSPHALTSKKEGPFTVVGKIKVNGGGEIIVISSPYVITNHYINYNLDFLRSIIGESAYIYPNPGSLLDYAKLLLKDLPNYSHLIAFSSFGILGLKFKKKNTSSKSVLEKVLSLHPDWDENVLRRIYNDRGEE